MAETNTGWTKEDPKVDGVYWWRADRTDLEPDVHSVVNGRFYEVGEQFSRVVENFGGEWLGPISPSDAEQLIELRKLAQDADDLIVKLYNADAIPTLMQYEVDGLRGRLHEAVLNPKQPEKETQ